MGWVFPAFAPLWYHKPLLYSCFEGTVFMSGHSKWATTKHRKAAQDAKRSALFSKLARNITVAAKEGGDPNPDNNASLAAAIEKAKGYSMPKDKIKTAIDKAFGSGKDAANYETVVYEGYGPAGVAVLLRGADRQPQPHRRRRARRLLPFRRQPGHLRLGGVPVRPQGPDHGVQGGRDRRQEEPRRARTAPLPTRRSSCSPWPRPAATTTRTPTTSGSSTPRRAISWPW